MELTTPRLIGAVCGLMLAIVCVQVAFPPSPPDPLPPEPAVACIGAPIPVEFAYTGWNKPHTCIVQCADNKPRYILYKDGRATQCETPPGCNDTGEDKGTLCEPPAVSTTK